MLAARVSGVVTVAPPRRRDGASRRRDRSRTSASTRRAGGDGLRRSSASSPPDGAACRCAVWIVSPSASSSRNSAPSWICEQLLRALSASPLGAGVGRESRRATRLRVECSTPDAAPELVDLRRGRVSGRRAARRPRGRGAAGAAGQRGRPASIPCAWSRPWRPSSTRRGSAAGDLVLHAGPGRRRGRPGVRAVRLHVLAAGSRRGASTES